MGTLDDKEEHWIQSASLEELKDALRVCRWNYQSLENEFQDLWNEVRKIKDPYPLSSDSWRELEEEMWRRFPVTR